MIHTLPDTPRHDRPGPVKFPSRPHVEELCRTRANNDNARWEAQVQRRDALISAAAQQGREHGHREGYAMGYHWGVVCGVCLGSLVVAALWILWAPLQAGLQLAGL